MLVITVNVIELNRDKEFNPGFKLTEVGSVLDEKRLYFRSPISQKNDIAL